MIILDEFIDLMKVVRIKMVAFYAEMPFDRFGKGLALCRRWSWRLCLRGAELDNRADPLA